MRTRVSELLGIEHPIIQGGLAYLALSQLAAAVSNAGGLGQITAGSLRSPGELRREIRETRRLTDKPFGVNFAIGQRPLQRHLEVALEEEVPVATLTWGNPEAFIRRMEGTEVKKDMVSPREETNRECGGLRRRQRQVGMRMPQVRRPVELRHAGGDWGGRAGPAR